MPAVSGLEPNPPPSVVQPSAMKLRQPSLTRRVLSIALPLVTGSTAVNAGSAVGFETLGPDLASDGATVAEQFRPARGIRFSHVDGSNVTLAQVGLPVSAFAAGADAAGAASGDSLLPSDPWLTKIGNFFLKLSGTAVAALVIDYDNATAGAAGLILDIDPDETWVIRAYSDQGKTLVAETILQGGAAGTGDQAATPWAIHRPSADIVQLRIIQTGSNDNAGAGLDVFHPYGTFDATENPLNLQWARGANDSGRLLLNALPGHEVAIESALTLSSPAWSQATTLTPVTAYSTVLSSVELNEAQRYYRAIPHPATDRADAIFSAVNAFLNTLTTAQRNSIVYAAGDATQRAKWSNFPTGIFQRNGLKIGNMTAEQVASLWSMLQAVLSPEGYQKIRNIVQGDEVLLSQGGGGNLTFGTAEYYVSFVGTPSVAGKYLIQFGGHHLAINVTVKGAQATIAPALPGVQPATYTSNGRTIRPIGNEYDLAFALQNSLTSQQRATAVVSSTVSDLALGPGKDGVTLLPEGLKASDMTESQRAILIDLISQYVSIIHDEASSTKIASIRAHLEDATDATYFSWRGPTTAGSAAYFRVQGPNLFIEYSPQSMGGSAVNHIHAMYREFSNDYGALIEE